MNSSKIIEIKLSNYRNFKNYSLDFQKNHCLLTGKNAVGKTNILEAISFLSPGNGFKKDKLDNILNSFSNEKGANIKIFFNYEGTKQNISINIEKKEFKFSKTYLLNDKKITQQKLLETFQLFWFSEQDKIFFIKDKQYRRGICNRIICYFDPNLFKLLNQYIKLRNEKRQVLLSSQDLSWLNSIDIQLIIVCKKIIEIKHQFMIFFNEYLTKNKNSFFEYKIDYDFKDISTENFLNDFESEMKKESESRGEYSFKSQYDPLKNVFSLTYMDSQIDQLSSAQSKLLILSFLLDAAKFLNLKKNKITIFLIDEIFDNFDIVNLQKVIEYCAKNNFQSFFSSTDNFAIKKDINNLEIIKIK